MLLHVPSQRYKRLKNQNCQNDRSGNSSVNVPLTAQSKQNGIMKQITKIFSRHFLDKQDVAANCYSQ